MYRKFETGQGLVEYAFIIILIALLVIGVLTLFGPFIGNVFTNIRTTLGV